MPWPDYLARPTTADSTATPRDSFLLRPADFLGGETKKRVADGPRPTMVLSADKRRALHALVRCSSVPCARRPNANALRRTQAVVRLRTRTVRALPRVILA